MLTPNTDDGTTQAALGVDGPFSALPKYISVESIKGEKSLIQGVQRLAAHSGFVWSDPGSGREMWAVGSAVRVTVSHRDELVLFTTNISSSGRAMTAGGYGAKPTSEEIGSVSFSSLFEDAQTQDEYSPAQILSRVWSVLSERFDSPACEERAIAYFGQVFDPNHPGDEGVWAGWPDAFLCVPEILYTQDRETGASTLLKIGGGDLASALSTQVQDEGDGGDTASGSVEWMNQESKGSWTLRVEEVVRDAEKGRVDKVVLARARCGRAPAGFNFDVQASLAHLWRSRDEGTVFSIAGDDQVFLGITPEHLVRVADGHVETHALAGTLGRNQGREALQDPKLLREHDLVVEQVKRDLASVVAPLTIDDAPTLTAAGSLVHLETKISGPLAGRSALFSVIAALHPTPALAGAPRALAIEWLRRNEGLRRGYYGAPIGWITPKGDGVCAVAIRSALIGDEQTWCFAGAGIVPGSSPDDEWDETAQKFMTVIDNIVLTQSEDRR